MSEKPKRGPGRPPSRTGTMEPLRVTITPADMQALDAYCEQHKMGRSEAIRLAVRTLTGSNDTTRR